MRVIDCPSCGSSDVDKNAYSAEYMSSVRWECEDCDWYYKKGRGMGVGSGNDGTHPARAGPSLGQSTLNSVGVYCDNCDTCVAGEHGCRPQDHVAPDELVAQGDVLSELEEWHYSPRKVLTDAVKNGDVTLSPVFFYVTVSDDTEGIDNELVRIIEQKEANDDTDYHGHILFDTIADAVCAENKTERAFVKRRLDELHRARRISKYRNAYGSA